ncbi:hypothetical protein UNSWCS_676 [Campylobacter concisus UNSWCS]|uniref:Uncharacterized protein n=1 Tax=Campylobacter concisus UNSWCS TaxID=1242968 RepID=U2FIR9_9BACT|nr:hypothetical protein UNSWCS_676 [Campylobacter concisus UNSWCS]
MKFTAFNPQISEFLTKFSHHIKSIIKTIFLLPNLARY